MPTNMKRPWNESGWSWAGAVALVLTFFLGGGWAAAVVFAISARTPPVSDNVTSLLTGVGGVLAGAIATFLGAQIGRRDRDNNKEKEP